MISVKAHDEREAGRSDRASPPAMRERRPLPAAARKQEALSFLAAAPRYWLCVYPMLRAQIEAQRRRACAIPSEGLRRSALQVLVGKRGNIDGAAAFAAFVPAEERASVLRAQFFFQSIYDYLDTLAELPHSRPVENSRRLHSALCAALDPDAQVSDFYALHPQRDDGGYLEGSVRRCQQALASLPSCGAVIDLLGRLGALIVDYQSLNVSDDPCVRAQFASWAARNTPSGSGLSWWETAASAGSSLGVFALIAIAGKPRAGEQEAEAVAQLYFPWIGALHSLLDSLIDAERDAISGEDSLIINYGDEAEAAERLRLLAAQSRSLAAQLPDPGSHLAVLASMAALYLAEPPAMSAEARRSRAAVLEALGPLTGPALAVMRVRRACLGRGGG